MSTASVFFGIICFSASLYAQFPSAPGFRVSGELRSHSDTGSGSFLVEVYDPKNGAIIERVPVSQGQFQLDHVPSGSYSVRVVTAPGEPPIVEEYHEFEPGGAPVILELPERDLGHGGAQPITGVVSLRELQHPVPEKARREAYEGQQYAHAHDLPKAIAKLKNAIRIDPMYRDAHCNLGVQYARAGRSADAIAEFQKALDIGPPAAPIYTDLALVTAAMRQFREAEGFARKALELDPANGAAQRTLEYASQHTSGH